ncbi:hypothetical protein DFJ73DRAFT_847551 [Zopfochytrium polystomum]|nr:hypothetical protein DFJ73DRAFT_847551 [Zopfochytrium polystomum]
MANGGARSVVMVMVIAFPRCGRPSRVLAVTQTSRPATFRSLRWIGWMEWMGSMGWVGGDGWVEGTDREAREGSVS